MNIHIKSYHKDIPELRTMLTDYSLDGGTILRTGGDGRMLPFDGAGEDAFSAEHYAKLRVVPDVRIESGMFYHIFPEAKKDNLVPVDYPESKDAEGEQMSYEDYFRKDTQYDLGDGTFLFRIVIGTNGLSDTDRRIYEADLGTLLVKSEGVALIPPAPTEK